MAVQISPFSGVQFFDNNGKPLAGGSVATFQAGTSTPIATYTDYTGATQNANSIVLDATGRPLSQIWQPQNTYVKYVLSDAQSNIIRTWDFIAGVATVGDLANYLPASSLASSSGAGGAGLVGFQNALVSTYMDVLTTAGTAPAFTLTTTPSFASLTSGKTELRVKWHAASAAPTLNVNSIGVSNVKQYDDQGNKVTATVTAGMHTSVRWDGTDWVVLDPLPPTTKYAFANGLTKAVASAISASPNYPRRYYPNATFIELLRLSPGVTAFEDQTGALTNSMNETYYRSVIGQMAAAGIDTIILPYVEYQGFWFYQPGFAFPTDYDTSRTGKYWGDWLTGFANVVPFDAVLATLQEASKYGMKVYIGLGRNGDTPLLGDLYSVNVLLQADPNRYGLSLTTRLNNAIARTQQVAADVVSKYSSYNSFAGFYLTHESSHINSSNSYFSAVCNTPGTNPSLRSYGKLIITAPANPLDAAANSTFANTLILSGVDIFQPQDSVGAGFDSASSTYTYVPQKSINTVAARLANWTEAIRIANAKAALTNRRIQLWATTEVWEMGVKPATTLTLSATSGASVTATAGTASFAAGDVGKWISTFDGGNAQITSFTSTTVVTVSTAVAGGRAFGSTSQTSGNWSLNSQYANAYPALMTRLNSQLLEEWPGIEGVCLYAWFGFIDSGTLSLRLSQSNSGFTDYRTRAAQLYTDYTTWQTGQRNKHAFAPNQQIVQMRMFSLGAQAAATTLTNDFGTMYPEHDGSKITYLCIINAQSQLGTTSITMNFRVNGIAVKSVFDASNTGYSGGTYVFMYQDTPKGLTKTCGISFTSSSTNVVLTSADILAIETT